MIASWRKLVLSLLLVISLALSSTKTTRLCFCFFGFVSICLFVLCLGGQEGCSLVFCHDFVRFYKVFFPLRSFPMHERCRVVTEAVQNTYATVVVVQKYSRTKRTLDYVRSIGQRRRSRRITTLYLCVCCRLVNFDSLRNRWRLQKSSVGKLHQEPDLSRSSVKSCDAALLK